MQTYLRLLTHSNLQRLFNEVEVLYKPVRPQQLAGHFAGVLRRLISGKFHAVVRPKGAGDQVRRDRTLYPAPANWENLAETFESLYQKSPLRSIRESGNLHEPMAISDITNRQTFESLDLYHEGYRILGVSDNLSVKILGHRVCVAVLRERRGFSDQDRAILSALRPHMERAYRYASELESWRATAKKGTEATDDTTGAAESLQGQDGASVIRLPNRTLPLRPVVEYLERAWTQPRLKAPAFGIHRGIPAWQKFNADAAVLFEAAHHWDPKLYPVPILDRPGLCGTTPQAEYSKVSKVIEKQAKLSTLR
jgi:hypothetical protein